MSKHDSATKRKRRPKSDKRVDYTASTMAAVKKLELAAKASGISECATEKCVVGTETNLPWFQM